MNSKKPNRRTVRATIRGSVPDGKLRKAQIVLKDTTVKEAIGGFTQYERENRGRVIKLGAPAGDNAIDMTVRGHETRHATHHKPTRKKPMTENEAIASQIVDDVNIEYKPLPLVKGIYRYQRNALAAAMRDVRTGVSMARKIKNGTLPDSWQARNAQLLMGLRASAMLQHYGKRVSSEVSLAEIEGIRSRGMGALRNILGHKTMTALRDIRALARNRRTRARAIAILTALMESAPPEDNEKEQERETPENESELLSPVTHGDALDGKMEIVQLLPRSAFTTKERQIAARHSPDGVIINPTRYVSAIASGDATGLFSRRIKNKPGGTVVIDASGSMGATSENLKVLARLIPSATIAYYSGNDRAYGKLSIYALKGRRFDGELPAHTLMGGNSVDLAAVRWLLKRDKPWTLISDERFTGGKLGSEVVAHALVEKHRMRGELTVHNSLDAAYEAFGGKGQLSDAARPQYKRVKTLRETTLRIRKAAADAKLKADAEARKIEADAKAFPHLGSVPHGKYDMMS